MMLYGIAPVHAALRAQRREMRAVYIKESGAGPALQEIERLAKTIGLRVERGSTHSLGNLAKSAQHQGVVLSCGELPTVDFRELLAAGAAPLVALDRVEDPQNLGSIARSALFFGVSALIVLSQHSAPLSAAASKASAGALEELPVAVVPNLAQALAEAHDAGYHLLGAVPDAGGVPLDSLQVPGRCLLVLGGEGPGLRPLTRRRCDQLVRIEGGGLESLNVGVAAGILLHRLRRDRPLPPAGTST